jgi:hypothetical protein
MSLQKNRGTNTMNVRVTEFVIKKKEAKFVIKWVTTYETFFINWLFTLIIT